MRKFIFICKLYILTLITVGVVCAMVLHLPMVLTTLNVGVCAVAGLFLIGCYVYMDAHTPTHTTTMPYMHGGTLTTRTPYHGGTLRDEDIATITTYLLYGSEVDA